MRPVARSKGANVQWGLLDLSPFTQPSSDRLKERETGSRVARLAQIGREIGPNLATLVTGPAQRTFEPLDQNPTEGTCAGRKVSLRRVAPEQPGDRG